MLLQSASGRSAKYALQTSGGATSGHVRWRVSKLSPDFPAPDLRPWCPEVSCSLFGLSPTGVEPVTFGSGGRRSIQLSYGDTLYDSPSFNTFAGLLQQPPAR